jgi:hypothetical protein
MNIDPRIIQELWESGYIIRPIHPVMQEVDVTDEMIAAAWAVIVKHRAELVYQPGAEIQTEIYRAMRALEPKE